MTMTSLSAAAPAAINYVLPVDLKEAVTIAELTERPLLIRGAPGTGKTLLADFLAAEKNLPLYKWHIKSTSLAVEGLYFYDAVARLNDSRFGTEEELQRVKNIENYIRLGALGQCFESETKSMALIDEIDKADIEFPNDLLLELDQMEFRIQETGRVLKAKHRPLVIITSNHEKELPEAFLRRCIFHYIKFPDFNLMEEIVQTHYPQISNNLLDYSLNTFYKLRELDDLHKKPSTSELIDWIKILLTQGADLKKTALHQIPFLGTLIKNEEDFSCFQGPNKR